MQSATIMASHPAITSWKMFIATSKTSKAYLERPDVTPCHNESAVYIVL